MVGSVKVMNYDISCSVYASHYVYLLEDLFAWFSHCLALDAIETYEEPQNGMKNKLQRMSVNHTKSSCHIHFLQTANKSEFHLQCEPVNVDTKMTNPAVGGNSLCRVLAYSFSTYSRAMGANTENHETRSTHGDVAEHHPVA